MPRIPFEYPPVARFVRDAQSLFSYKSFLLIFLPIIITFFLIFLHFILCLFFLIFRLVLHIPCFSELHFGRKSVASPTDQWAR